MTSGGEDNGEGKGGKYLEKENIWPVDEKKNGEGRGKRLRRKIFGEGKYLTRREGKRGNMFGEGKYLETENIWPAEERKMGKNFGYGKYFACGGENNTAGKAGKFLEKENFGQWRGKKRRRNIFGDGKNNNRQMDRISSCSINFSLQTSFICFLKIPTKDSSLKCP